MALQCRWGTLPGSLARVGCAACLVVLLIVAARSGGLRAAAEAGRHVGPATAALVLLITTGSMLISGLVWTRLLRCLGCPASLRLGLALYAGSGLAAYLGAGAGAAAYCALRLRAHGVGAPRAVLLLAMASLVGFCGAMAWAPWGLALLASPAASRALPALGAHGGLVAVVVTIVFTLGALGVLISLALVPRLTVRLRIARLLPEPDGSLARPSLSRLLASIPLAALAWAIGAGALWLLVRAVAPQASLSLPTAIGIQAMAALAGSVACFLPGGLGAREGAIVGLLVGVAGVPVAAAAAVAAAVRASDPAAKLLILATLAASGRVAGLLAQGKPIARRGGAIGLHAPFHVTVRRERHARPAVSPYVPRSPLAAPPVHAD